MILYFGLKFKKLFVYSHASDTKYSDETELKKNYKRVISDGTNIIKIVRFFHKKDDCKKCSYQLNNSVFIGAVQKEMDSPDYFKFTSKFKSAKI